MEKDNGGTVKVERGVRRMGEDPKTFEEAMELAEHWRKCLLQAQDERDRYRLVLELIIKRNKLMNPTICLDMLDKEAKRALGDA